MLCRLYPVDKSKNADGVRRTREPSRPPPAKTASGAMAPLLSQLVDEYNRAGLPPAYLVKNEEDAK